jgi:holo-[acyl-carrier protein] synthase
MILGIGHDMVSIERVAGTLDKFGERFTARVFTAFERARSDRRRNRAESYAKRFAAKEAAAKALGTGVPAQGVFWRDFGVVNLPSGKPTLVFTGKAREHLDRMTPPGHEVVVHLTMTDDPPWAVAHVILEARPLPAPVAP